MIKLSDRSLQLLFGADKPRDTEAGAREPFGTPARFSDSGKAVELVVPRDEDPLFDKKRRSSN